MTRIQSLLADEFAAISVGTMLTAVLLSFLLGIFIAAVYRVAYTGILFQKSFALCLVLLSMITALVILTISSNVVLSLGMVGALSIVRFRTAVKEPMDTIFMFWAIVAGIITGAGYVAVSVIATLLIGMLFLILSFMGAGFRSSAYLLVLRYHARADSRVTEALSALPRYKLRSKNTMGDVIETVIEVKLTPQQLSEAEGFARMEGVTECNLLSYQGTGNG